MIKRMATICGFIGALIVPQATGHLPIARASCPYYQYTDQWYTHENNPQNLSQTDYVGYKTTYYYTIACGAQKSIYGYGVYDWLDTSQWASLRWQGAWLFDGGTAKDNINGTCAALPTTQYYHQTSFTPSSTVVQETAWGNANAVNCAAFDGPVYTLTHQPS